jgi:hypothetical protein
LAIDPDTVQVGAQKIVDALTCQGIGGIVSATLGFMSTSSKEVEMIETAMGQVGVPLDSTILKILPRGPFMVTSEGNNFEIIIEPKSAKINGQSLVVFATLTGLHGECTKSAIHGNAKADIKLQYFLPVSLFLSFCRYISFLV